MALAALSGLANKAHQLRTGREDDKWIPTKGELGLVGGHGANLVERHLEIEGDLDAVDLFGIALGGGLYAFRNITGAALLPEDDELAEKAKDTEPAFRPAAKPRSTPEEAKQP